MAGRDVHEASTLLGGDEVAGQKRDRKAIAVGQSGQWMAGDATRERSTLEFGQRAMALDASGVGHLRQPLGSNHEALPRPREAAVADLPDLDQPVVDRLPV